MKNLIQLLAAMLLPLSLLAQLSGTLTDKSTGEKIPGAVITIESSYATSTSDVQGNFSFDHLNEKNVTLHVHHVSYELFTQTIMLPATDIKLQLQPRDIISDEVTVIATRAGNQSATAYTNVSKENIEKNNLGQDLPYLLNLTPSVVTTSDAGTGIGYTSIRIRGSDATRVNVTINGIPVNDAEEHAVYWVDLPDFASSVDNIQIQRGVGTSTNGAGAFGGSVNIQSNKLSPDPYAAVNSSYGSFNSWKNTVEFGSGLIDKSFSFEGRLSKITSDGYIDRGSSDLKSFYLSGGYYSNNSSLRLIIFSGTEKTYQAWNGVPESRLNGDVQGMESYISRNGLNSADSANLLNSNSRTYNSFTYPNQTDNYQQDYYQLLWNKSLNKYWVLNAALHYTKGKGYYEEYEANDLLSNYGIPNPIIGNDTITNSNIIRQQWLNNDFYGFTYSLNYEKDNVQITLGGAGNQYKGEHYGTVIWAQYAGNSSSNQKYYDNNATKNDFNMFGKITYKLNPQWHLFADMQYRTIGYTFLGLDTTGSPLPQTVHLNFFNPKGGITFEPKKNQQLYATVSVGHNEPVRDDYVESSPLSRPKPEEMQDAEAGYKYTSNKFLFNANYYFMNYSNQLVLTGKVNDVGQYTRQNVDKSYREGIEIEAGYRLSKKVNVSGNVTLSQNKIQTFDEYIDNYDYSSQLLKIHNNTDIAFSPSVIAAGIIAYSPINALHFEFTTKYVGKQFLDNTSEDTRSLNPYLLNDVHIVYSIHTSLIKEISFKLMVNNIFNHLYESNGYTYSYQSGGQIVTENFYYPQAGRNWFGGISMKF